MFYTLIAMTTNPIRDETYFTSPATEWQRRYEALRASMVERLPDKAVANRFGYTTGYLRVLRHQFRHGLLDFHEPVPEGSQQRRTVNAEARAKIRTWREQRLSVGEIAELLCEDGTEISVRTVGAGPCRGRLRQAAAPDRHQGRSVPSRGPGSRTGARPSIWPAWKDNPSSAPELAPSSLPLSSPSSACLRWSGQPASPGARPSPR